MGMVSVMSYWLQKRASSLNRFTCQVPPSGNRQSQLAELLRQFGDQPNVIVSGDFNQATIDEFDPFVKAGFKLANGGGLGMFLTHRRRKTSFTPAIDNLLVKGFDILSVRTGDDSMILSDHRMLVCRLRARVLEAGKGESA